MRMDWIAVIQYMSTPIDNYLNLVLVFRDGLFKVFQW